MPFTTNNHARQLRKQLGQPKQYGASPHQWAYVAGVHGRGTTTLSANAAAGATSLSVAFPVAANSMIIVGTGGPVLVESFAGSGPYTLTLGARGIPHAATSGATVRILATVDVYLDGWQNPPAGLPPGVGQILTTGVRYLHGYTPTVGHVVLIARGTGLQKSDRVILGRLE
jgi:hypothetical protein